LCEELLRRKYQVRAAMRAAGKLPEGVESVVVGEIGGNTIWSEALRDVQIVMHLAAALGSAKDSGSDELAQLLRVNLDGTTRLARQAADAGVKRLVYVSSAKVHGEHTSRRPPFTENDTPLPQGPYAISKLRAEQGLRQIARETGLEAVVLRPPLVYGPGVKGSFLGLLSAIDRGAPLPLSGASNRRSLVYVGNLVDAVIACATDPAAEGQTYLVKDGEDVSVAALVRKIASAFGRRARMFYVPAFMLRGAAFLFGRTDQLDKLLLPSCVSDEKIRGELRWAPRYTLEQGLAATTAWYGSQRNGYNSGSS
jgi:nucleoside-diphosphate-sugar epimerase